MLRDLTRGATYFWRGFSLLAKPRIRVWAFIPIAISFVVFIGSAVGIAAWLDPFVERATNSVPEWLSWIEAALWVLFVLTFLLLSAFTFVIVASVIACPFNGMLAEATEKHVTGSPPPDLSISTTLKRLPRTLTQESKKVLYYFVWAIPFLLLFLIPPINLAAPALWVLFSAWMLALEFSDYPMDNNELLFHEIRARLARRRWLTLGFGAMTFFVATIPLVNILVVPAAVCGATVMWVDELSEAA